VEVGCVGEHAAGADALNTAPVIDPVATVVLAADVSNVAPVIINGVFQKRDGKLLRDLSTPRKLIEESKDYRVRAVPTQAGWLIPEAV
jgi:cytosine/adenosine deaminase-related metal-dependent hydrolase